MIELSLWHGSESSISLDRLGAAALTRVIEALRDCHYEVSASAGSGEGRLSSQVFDIEPGRAALTVVTDAGRGEIRFVLDGDRFGASVADRDTDQLLWMRLVTLGVELAERYSIEPKVWDPGLGVAG